MKSIGRRGAELHCRGERQGAQGLVRRERMETPRQPEIPDLHLRRGADRRGGAAGVSAAARAAGGSAGAPRPRWSTLSAGRYVGVPEAAAFAGVEQETIRAWIGRRLRAFKPSGSREHRLHLPDLRAWIEGAEEPGAIFTGEGRALVGRLAQATGYVVGQRVGGIMDQDWRGSVFAEAGRDKLSALQRAGQAARAPTRCARPGRGGRRLRGSGVCGVEQDAGGRRAPWVASLVASTRDRPSSEWLDGGGGRNRRDTDWMRETLCETRFCLVSGCSRS